MNQVEFLSALEQSSQALLAIYTDAGDELAARPGAIGHWALKDVLINLDMWNYVTAVRLDALHREIKPSRSELFGREYPADGMGWGEDEINEWMVGLRAGESTAQVVAAFERTHRLLVEAVKKVDAVDWNDPQRQFVTFSWKGERPLSEVVADFTFRHQNEHAQEMRAWLDAHKS